MLGRRKGLSFTRRRKRIETSAIQAGLFWAGECILAFAIGCVLVFYFMSRLTCVGQAMEPSINSGNSVLVNRFSYAMTTPKRGRCDRIQAKWQQECPLLHAPGNRCAWRQDSGEGWICLCEWRFV